MASAAHVQSSFVGGEFGKRFSTRIDQERYATGVAQCVNWIVPLQGCAYRRPGSEFVALAGDQTSPSVLVRFEFSTTQVYVIEFGHLFIRFYRNGAQITSGGLPVEVASPYDEADLFELQFVQSLDVLYITHHAYKTRKLTRSSHTSWTLTDFFSLDGPYLDTNTNTAHTLTPSGTTLTITVTASIATFALTDVGRLIRMFHGATWAYVLITGFTSSTQVTAIVQGATALGGTTATASWRLGVWSDTTGYPACAVFYQDRLVFGGTTSFPNRLYFSETGEYEKFAPTSVAGTITDAHGITIELNSAKVQDIRALVYDAEGLTVLTGTSEWIVRGATSSKILTPTNFDAVEQGSEGSELLPAIRIGTSIIFLQRGGRKLKEIQFYLEQNGFKPVDLSYIADHATQSGVRQFCYQQKPDPIVWCVRNDGVLAGMTYARNLETLQVAWHRHTLGGVSTDGGAPAKVESACVIPGSDGQDELWLQVQRYVDGTIVRHIERVKPPFEEGDHQHNAWYVDCALSRAPGTGNILSVFAVLRNSPISIYTSDAHGLANDDKIFLAELEGLTLLTDADADLNSKIFTVQGVSATATITLASPGVVTWTDHKLVAGDPIKFATTGALPTGITAGTIYFVKSPTANTFEFSATSGGASINTSGAQSGAHTVTATSRIQIYEGDTAVDGALYASWQQGGRLAKLISSISGLTHLRGQTVQTLGDGGAQEATVTDDGTGTVTLDPPVGFVVSGLGYQSDLQTLRVEAGGADGPALGKVQKLEEVSLVVEQTLGIQVGRDEDNLGEQIFRDPDTAAGIAPPLISGILECENFEGDYGLDNRIYIRQSAPLPATILAIACQAHTEERQ